jgi:hypothetical protein
MHGCLFAWPHVRVWEVQDSMSPVISQTPGPAQGSRTHTHGAEACSECSLSLSLSLSSLSPPPPSLPLSPLSDSLTQGLGINPGRWRGEGHSTFLDLHKDSETIAQEGFEVGGFASPGDSHRAPAHCPCRACGRKALGSRRGSARHVYVCRKSRQVPAI